MYTVNFVEYGDIVKLHIRKHSQRRLHKFSATTEKRYNFFNFISEY
jgi:hypothetical protein